MSETSRPKDIPIFPAAEEVSSLPKVDEKLPEEIIFQLMTPLDVNCL